MRPERLTLFASLLACAACAETPRCVERGTPPTLQTECNAGKVAVCGSGVYDMTTGAGIYDPNSGGLVRVPATVDGVQLACADYTAYPARLSCRPSPYCTGPGATPTCPNGEEPRCVLGAENALPAPIPTATDSGPPPDAGAPVDAGIDSGP